MRLPFHATAKAAALTAFFFTAIPFTLADDADNVVVPPPSQVVRDRVRVARSDHHHHYDVLTGDQLIDMKIKDRDGKAVGEIKDLVIDVGNGRAAYAVLSRGGHLEAWQQYRAIPLQALEIESLEGPAVLCVSRDAFKKSKGFGKHSWPDVSDVEYADKTYSDCGCQPYWTDHDHTVFERDGRFWTKRLSQLTGVRVDNPRGDKLGQITDLAIDTRNGRVAYALLKFGGFAGFGERIAVIPWAALKYEPKEKRYILDEIRGQLEAQSYPENTCFDFNNEKWGREVHHRYHRTPYWEEGR